MKFKERLAEANEMMSPFRKKINYIAIPAYLITLVCSLAAALPWVFIDEKKYYPVMIVWACLAVVSILVWVLLDSWFDKKETEIELERWGFLFKKPKKTEMESFCVDGDGGIRYTLTKDGITAECQAEEEQPQVFEEANENLMFLPWDTVELALATQTAYRRVYLAIAVLYEDPSGAGDGVLILPLTETLFTALRALGLQDRLSGDWGYLFYNPEHAFRQILARGRIIQIVDKKTGKPFADKNGNFTGEE